MNEEEFLKQFIKNNPFDFKQGIINHCRQLDKLDVYEWVAEDELKIQRLQQENRQLKEKIILLQASEPMLELTKYYGERDKYKSVLDEIRKYIETHVKEHIHDDYDVTLYNSLNQDECDELLQILDKVKE